jgi:hypothetical protein
LAGKASDVNNNSDLHFSPQRHREHRENNAISFLCVLCVSVVKKTP